MTSLGLVLGVLAAAGPADAGCGPTPATQPARSYCIECTCTKVGPGGKEKCIARPVLLTLDGGTVTFISGGQAAVRMADANGTVEFVPFGLSVRAKVKELDQAKVRVDATVETTEREQTKPDDIRLQGNSVHAILTVKLGEAVKLVQKGPDGKAQHSVQLKITEVPPPAAAARSSSANTPACGYDPAQLAYGAAWLIRRVSVGPAPVSPEGAATRPAPRPAPATRATDLGVRPAAWGVAGCCPFQWGTSTLASAPYQAPATPAASSQARTEPLPAPTVSEPPAPVAAYTPAPAVTAVPPAPPAVPHANDVRAEVVEGHPGLIRLTTLLHAAARDGSAAPPIPFVQYVCVPTSVHQLRRQARKGGGHAGTAALEQKLDRILDRLAEVEKWLSQVEHPASAPADKGPGAAAPTGCPLGTGAAPISLDFRGPVQKKSADQREAFQFWVGQFH
jgi:hypothetical protein